MQLFKPRGVVEGAAPRRPKRLDQRVLIHIVWRKGTTDGSNEHGGRLFGAPRRGYHAAVHTYADDFSNDMARWDGGVVEDGVLRVQDGEATLTLDGQQGGLEGSVRVRMVDGVRLVLRIGDAVLGAYYDREGGLSLDYHPVPLPKGQYVWEADPAPVSIAGADALDGQDAGDVAYDEVSGRYFLGYTSAFGGASGQIGIATSDDALTWTAAPGNPVISASFDGAFTRVGSPTMEFDADRSTAMAFACQDAASDVICFATSPDGFTWNVSGARIGLGESDAFDAGALGWPILVAQGDGTWATLYSATDDGGTLGMGWATASSLDGPWEKRGATSGALVGRGHGQVGTPYGIERLGDCDGDLCWASADSSDLGTWTSSGIALQGANAVWTQGQIYGGTLTTIGSAYHTWFSGRDAEGASRIGHARTVPAPGEWMEIALQWYGGTLSVGVGGATFTTPLTTLGQLVVSATGTAEVDDVQLLWGFVDGDTGEQRSGGHEGSADGVDRGCGCVSAPSRGWNWWLGWLPLSASVFFSRSRRPAPHRVEASKPTDDL